MAREDCPRFRPEGRINRCNTPYTTTCHYRGDDFRECAVYELVEEDRKESELRLKEMGEIK
ncbi:hypothetical protein CMI46_01040 [Candidatus Pacearchaeota archaeon]|nr:hypothetical protein [Candidatus Pacearchaeota archaeon]